jgi:Peptidase family M23/Abnormal spindle-like microcephaly-assoc'd, ASPM-SPD-2-Hydin
MRYKINTILFIFLLLITLVNCKKKDATSNNLGGYTGGGTTACSFPELKTNNLPVFTWVLDGTQRDYQSYSTNGYFTYGKEWLSGDSYLCNGKTKFHTGWDIHRPGFTEIKDTKVFAAYAGQVKAVYNAGIGFAQGITIEHTDLSGGIFTTNYTHVDPVPNIQGATVTAGQLIGYVADLAKDDHLHFSLRRAQYSNNSNKGALPKYQNDANCNCGGDPVFPEYFVNPGNLSFQNQTPPNQTRVINLSGNLAFGNVIIGNTPTKAMTITNNGNSNLTISSISLPNGYSSDYNSGVIQPGFNTTANIKFTPVNTVWVYNGIITVNSNATSGGNTIPVSGSGVNGTSANPTFSPLQGTPTNCNFNNQPGSGNCAGSNYLGGVIRMKVSGYNPSSNTINFIIEKCSSTFSNNGTAYIKQGDYCGTLASQVNYNAGASIISISVTPPLAAGSYTYTAVLVSATTDKFYTLSIQVTY